VIAHPRRIDIDHLPVTLCKPFVNPLPVTLDEQCSRRCTFARAQHARIKGGAKKQGTRQLLVTYSMTHMQ
jgi:hypothetical protein